MKRVRFSSSQGQKLDATGHQALLENNPRPSFASVRIPLHLLLREKAEDIARIRTELMEKGRVSLALLISLRC